MNSQSHLRKTNSYESDGLQRNSLIFGIAMILLQIGLSLVYGFLINIEAVQLNVSSIIIIIGLAILIIGGFGLVFGYTRKLVWSGIGFTFFITALCIEVYPLINDFWTKTRLQTNHASATDFRFDNKSYNIFLTDRETGNGDKANFYGNSITNALKCGLSISIAFSAILGRAGNLQCLIVTLLGTVGFELNRQIIQQKQGIDTFGTFYIFTFGGFMGLMLGFFSFIRERKVNNQIDKSCLKKYTGSEFSVLLASFGALIIFALFPLLSYQFDAYSRYQQFSPYSNPICIIAGLGAGAIGSMIGSFLINGYLVARDGLHGPIAGAIVVGASSLYITNPVYAFVAGAAGGLTQSIIQNIIEKQAIKRNLIISTVSWSLFGIQGLIGAGFASGWYAVIKSNSNGQTIEPKTLQSSSHYQFYSGLISAGIGAGFGIIIGLILLAINKHESQQYFQDLYYWYARDSIGYDKKKKIVSYINTKQQPKNEQKPQPEVIGEQPAQKKGEESEQSVKQPSLQQFGPVFDDQSDEFGYSIEEFPVQNPYAYL